MEVDKLYKLNRGNQNQTVGLIVNGVGATINVLGSSVMPTSLSDLSDCANGTILTEGTHTFSVLPEYVYFSGTADRIDIVGMNYVDTLITLL